MKKFTNHLTERNNYWKSAAGRIKVMNMTNRHLENAVEYLSYYVDASHQVWKRRFQTELKFRHEVLKTYKRLFVIKSYETNGTDFGPLRVKLAECNPIDIQYMIDFIEKNRFRLDDCYLSISYIDDVIKAVNGKDRTNKPTKPFLISF